MPSRRTSPPASSSQRLRLSEVAGRALVAAWQAGGLTQAAFARRRGVSAQRLSYWRLRLRQRGKASGSSDVGFVEIPAPASSTPLGGRPVFVEMSGGVRIHVTRGFDPVVLRAVVAALADPADDDASNHEERAMHGLEPFVANLQPPESFEPGEGALNHPAMPSKVLFRLDVAPGYAIDDPPLAERLPATWIVVSLVGMELAWFAARTTARALDGRDGIQYRHHHLGIVNIRRRDCDRNWNAPSIDRDVVFDPISSAIRGIRAQRFAPFLAGMFDPSTQTRRRSTPPSLPKVPSRCFQIRSQAPFFCHSINRRRQVLPDPQPSSGGNAFHGMANLRTIRMPSMARRSSTRGRPPFLEVFRGRGRRGWMRFQSPSGSRLAVIHPS